MPPFIFGIRFYSTNVFDATMIPYPLEISMCIRSERKCRPKYTSTVKVRAMLVVRLPFPLPLNRFSMVNYTECIKPYREKKPVRETLPFTFAEAGGLKKSVTDGLFAFTQ